jgi:hypothetical protein
MDKRTDEMQKNGDLSKGNNQTDTGETATL